MLLIIFKLHSDDIDKIRNQIDNGMINKIIAETKIKSEAVVAIPYIIEQNEIGFCKVEGESNKTTPNKRHRTIIYVR